MDDAGPLCLGCADMDHLVFLPSGEAALTRRAKKASGLSAVVVRWSRTRKRYERQGLLVEDAALEQAEQQCLADEDVRMRRRGRDQERRTAADVELQAVMIEEIKRLFALPGRRAAIAGHQPPWAAAGGRSAVGDHWMRRLTLASSRRCVTRTPLGLPADVRAAGPKPDPIRPAVDRRPLRGHNAATAPNCKTIVSKL
jgi:hypothetical protein